MELPRIKKDDCDITSDRFLRMEVVWCCGTNTISIIGSWFICNTSTLSVSEVSCPLSVKRAEWNSIFIRHHRLLLQFTLCK